MEQESQLAEQNKLISELQETISQLRAEVVTTRLHLLEQKQAQKEIQSQAEALQHKELQTRVALERISTKVSVASSTSEPCLPLGTHLGISVHLFPSCLLIKQTGLKYQKPLRNLSSDQLHHQISNILPGSK